MWREHKRAHPRRLRHELEHARQWEALGPGIFNRYDVIKLGVLPHKAGGLAGCGDFYINSIPAEQDANAAASMYLESRHPEASQAIRDSEQRNLACTILPPEPIATLQARMLAHLALFPSACAATQPPKEPTSPICSTRHRATPPVPATRRSRF